MSRPLPALLLALLLVTAGCASVGTSPSTPGDARQATVTRVVDGDTVEVRFGDGSTDTVRLLGVDSPEVSGVNDPGEFEGVPDSEAGRRCLADAGDDATAFVEDWLADATVEVVTDPVADRRGDYGRLLAYVELQNGTDLNHRLVETGHARVYDSSFSRSDPYYAAEATAQDERRGLWRCREPAADGGAVGDAPLRVVSIHADAPGNDHENLNGEYVTFRNAGNASLAVGGWTVRDAAGAAYSVPDGVAIGPNATLTLYTGSGADDADALYWGSSDAVWNNGGDTVVVTNETGAVVVEYRY